MNESREKFARASLVLQASTMTIIYNDTNMYSTKYHQYVHHEPEHPHISEAKSIVYKVHTNKSETKSIQAK
jgi:hypothetical protein